MILYYLGISIFRFLGNLTLRVTPKVSKVELRSEKYNETLYLKKKIWGITGDHQVIVITKYDDEVEEPKVEFDYIYEGMTPFFYEFKNDTLKVFVRKKSDVPDKLLTKIEIVQVVLDNIEMRNLAKSYIEKNLNIF